MNLLDICQHSLARFLDSMPGQKDIFLGNRECKGCVVKPDPDHSTGRKRISFVKTSSWQSLREQRIPDGRKSFVSVEGTGRSGRWNAGQDSLGISTLNLIFCRMLS